MSDTLHSSSTDGHKDNSLQPGQHSLTEILAQPSTWANCIRLLTQEQRLKDILARFGGTEEWLFIGCGSSYYIAMAAAASLTALSGRRARALPASELLLYPDLAFSSGDCVPVLISRSGQTSEVLRAAEVLRDRKINTLAISCTPGQELQALATEALTLPADEKSTVMTRSFSSMLLSLQFLAAKLGGNLPFCDALAAMPDRAAVSLKDIPNRIRGFVDEHAFEDYVALGHGPFYGLACEYALKAMEMSVSYSQFFHPLEFRHGPKSIVRPETLLSFLISDNGQTAELDLLEEMKSLGATTLVVTDRANARMRAAADLLVELSLDVPEFVRLAPSLMPGQLLGLYTGLKKGLDPDSPRNLSRAVILDKESSKRPEHASL